MSTSLKPTEHEPTEHEPTELKIAESEITEPKPTRLDKLRSNKWLIGLLILIPIMGFLGYGQVVIVPIQQAKSKVQTAPVGRGNLAITISANGTVQPERSVNVSPKTAGILKQLLVKEGDVVEQGQVLAYMDDSNLQGELQQTQGKLAAAANLQRLRNGNRAEDIATVKAELAEQKFRGSGIQHHNR